MVTRHQFLTMLHDLLKPVVYLEIGVQYGLSLDLAVHSEWAIGVDPNPLVEAKGKQTIYRMTSDQYFQFPTRNAPDQVDLAFIDGSHLWEDAFNDFIEIAQLCGPQSVVVFDDVLPYSNEIAQRTPLPGDWTGDVWKLGRFLPIYIKNLKLVNTFPTGTMVAWGFPADVVGMKADSFTLGELWHEITTVPNDVINRVNVHEPEDIIDLLREDLCVSP